MKKREWFFIMQTLDARMFRVVFGALLVGGCLCTSLCASRNILVSSYGSFYASL